MINFNDVQEPLEKDEILDMIDDIEIFEFYFGEDIEIGKFYCNPLRDDTSPGCFFGYSDGDGSLLFSDLAIGMTVNCFGFIMKMYDLNFTQALYKIQKDLLIEKREKPDERKVRLKAKKKTIKIKSREWTEKDLEYWMQFGVSKKTLNRFKVRPVKYVFVDGEIVWEHYDSSPIYAYNINGRFKIYRPYEVEQIRKWRQNLTKEDIQGWDQLQAGDNLVITKSLKDVMCLHEFGIAAIAPTSESVTFTEEFISELKRRYSRIVVLYDNDEAGIKNANKHAEMYGLEVIFIPTQTGAKDISDYFKMYGKEQTEKFITECLSLKERNFIQFLETQ